METRQNVVKIEEAKGNGKQEKMSKIMIELLKKKEEIEKTFAQLKEAETKLLEIAKNNNDQFQALRVQMFQCQGAYKEINSLIDVISKEEGAKQ